MSRKNTNQPEYGTELKLAAVRRGLAGESVRIVAQELTAPSPQTPLPGLQSFSQENCP
jgi:hypothetical protein